MSCDAPTFVIVGRIGAPYGIRGWVHVKSFTTPASNLLSYEPWFTGSGDGNWQQVWRLATRSLGNQIVACVNESSQPEMTTGIRGLLVAVKRQQLPMTGTDEYYFSDLEGKTVLTDAGVCLGKVNSVLDTGASAVLDVKGDVAEYLIPFVKPILISVDVDRVTVDWDEDWSK